MSIAINEIIAVTGHKQLDFQPKYPIDENTTVELSGQFRSTGTESSMIYFGLFLTVISIFFISKIASSF